MPSCVIARRETRCFTNVFAIILLLAKKALKNFSKKLYTSKKKKKRRSRDEIQRLGLKKMPKLAHIFAQSSGTRQVLPCEQRLHFRGMS